MASKSKLYIMVMLCKPQNLHFRAERISTNNKAKFYISHLCNLTAEFKLFSRRVRGSWNQIPKVLPACSELATPFHIDMQPPTVPSLPSRVDAITYAIWNLHSLFLICVFQVPLHPKSQGCLVWCLYLLTEHKT